MSTRRTRRSAVTEPEQPPAPPTQSVPAPGEPSAAEKLSLKREFDRLFQKTSSDKKDVFTADGDTERKVALVELEDDLDNLGALVARLETRAAFGWNLRYTDMTPWVAEFPPSAQSSIVKRLKENMLRLHARIFELSLSTPLGYSEGDGSAGEEEGEVESEEEEVVPVSKGKSSKGKSSVREVEVEPEVVELNDPPCGRCAEAGRDCVPHTGPTDHGRCERCFAQRKGCSLYQRPASTATPKKRGKAAELVEAEEVSRTVAVAVVSSAAERPPTDVCQY
ncbi:hypothetical protein BYT27DRAFT_7342113 [Phlegmacium glaucopus]|nr:hypothetical protein BYT27DRAFT_7342113 [Phlegmacium glaucopus]